MHIIILMNVTVRIDLCNSSELVHLNVIQVDNSEILSGWKEEGYCTGADENMVFLLLSRSNLTVLPSNLIKRMTNLELLHVHGNHLTDCPGNALGLLRKLHTFNIGNNRLRNLTADCFQSLGRLTDLILSENEIMSIEEGTFVSLVSLRTINLTSNKLVSIERRTFAGLVNLTYLYLARNKLVSIEGGTFTFLINLEYLDLSFNELINIHSSVFLPVDMEELFKPLIFEYVDLSYNKLNEVILSADSMATIAYLDLSNNSIRKIEVRNVEVLNLSYNRLDHIPDGLVDILEDLKSVDFGGNNLECCHRNNVMLTESTVIMYNLGTREPFYCFLNDQQVTLQSTLLNSSLCVKLDSTFYVELWISLGVFTAVTTVFMSFVYYYRTELAYLSLFAKMLKRGIRTDEQKYSDAAYDAFVCYRGKNLVWIVRHLLPSVEETDEGYRLCIHDRDFALGAAIDTNVLTALDKSRKVIFVLSPDFMSSKWCRWELEMATHKMFEEERNYIILIEMESLECVVLPKQLKYLMKTRTYLHWPGDSASEDDTVKFWEGLYRALGQSLLCKTGRQLPTISVLDIEE